MNRETLKPCPFCRALPQVTPTYTGGHSVTIPHVHGCVMEELSGVLCDTTEAFSKFIAAWNTRIDQAEGNEQKDPLRIALERAALDLHEAAGRFGAISKLNAAGAAKLTREAARRADAALHSFDRGDHLKGDRQMSDIAERLRKYGFVKDGIAFRHPMADEAADEIERLRAVIERLGSSGTMTTTFIRRNNAEGRELAARMEYARQALQETDNER